MNGKTGLGYHRLWDGYRFFLRSLIWYGILFLIACQPITATPQPTDRVWYVQITPSLSWISANIHQCANKLGGTAVFLKKVPAPNLSDDPFDFRLTWGSPENLNTPAFVLGWEEIVPVVNPQNPIKELTLDQFKEIYSRKNLLPQEDNSPGKDIHPWMYPVGNEIQKVFNSLIDPSTPLSTSMAGIAPDPQAMRQAVANDPAAIGYIPRRWLDSSVKAVQWVNTDETTMRQPILAITKTQPDGKLLEWLQCLQNELAQPGA